MFIKKNCDTALLISLLVIVEIFCQIAGQKQGDACENKDGSPGVCKLQKTCSLPKVTSKQKRPKVCSFQYDEPVICCPTTTAALVSPEPLKSPRASEELSSDGMSISEAAAIAKRKCADYGKTVIVQIPSPVIKGEYETINLCGRREEALIVGGEKAKEKEFPHMAQIGYGDNDISWLCGGSLISERFVLSAAHCSFLHLGKAQWVKLGEYDTSSEDDSDPTVIQIVKIINHPLYNADVNSYNDIALYKLEQMVKFNGYIRPICLPTSDHSHLRTAIASGWGHTEWGGIPSDVLLKVELNLVNNPKCNEIYSDGRGRLLPKGIIDSQRCAGDAKGRDTCQEDSGGPLQSPIDTPYCMYEILGVTSFGKGCGLGYPGVYTKTWSFLPWIVKTVWPNN